MSMIKLTGYAVTLHSADTYDGDIETVVSVPSSNDDRLCNTMGIELFEVRVNALEVTAICYVNDVEVTIAVGKYESMELYTHLALSITSLGQVIGSMEPITPRAGDRDSNLLSLLRKNGELTPERTAPREEP